ncbi:MAG: insulinase family protein [Hydrogenophilus sp.]|nr:insulinase family protein [Hydrogenophilus sp.]
MRRSLFSWFLFPLILSLPLPAPAFQLPQIETARLANGMEVIVVADHRAPSVVHMIWYDAGSVDEPSGKSGLAHLFEHMMFKGTPSVPAGELSRRVAALGGRDNAFTSRDYTAYFQQIPPAALLEVMRLEADRMTNLQFDITAFRKELAVVQEERKLRTDDFPKSLAYETLLATALIAHPARNPVIGWPTDLEALTLDDLVDWYRRWYAPNNARLIIVGDVDPTAVLHAAEAIFGSIPPNPAVPPVAARSRYEDPPQRGMRHATIRAAVELPTLFFAWKVPPLRDPDRDRQAAALIALAALLDGFEGARLPRALIKTRRLAIAVSAEVDLIGRAPGLFLVEAQAAPGVSLESLAEAILSEITAIAEGGTRPDELERVLRHYTAQQIYQRDSLMGEAMRIGMARAANLPADTDARLLALLKTISPADVQEAASRWFSRDTLTRVDLLPLSASRTATGALP